MLKPDAGPLFEGGKPSVTGCVYVARTLSTNLALTELADHILKIGSTTETAAGRIAGAATDSTFLLAEATIVDEYETRGVPPKKIESLLHRFFGAACVDVQLPDRFGRSVDPREWFMVSRTSVEEAMRLIATKALHLYQYDTAEDRIIPR